MLIEQLIDVRFRVLFPRKMEKFQHMHVMIDCPRTIMVDSSTYSNIFGHKSKSSK